MLKTTLQGTGQLMSWTGEEDMQRCYPIPQETSMGDFGVSQSAYEFNGINEDRYLYLSFSF
jgi:hypothetical protein